MTHPRKHLPAPAAIPEGATATPPRKSHSSRNRHSSSGSYRNTLPTGPSLSKYGELFQEIQDEVSYFLPVDALAAGTYRYLYHLGDYSPASIAQMQQFLSEKRETLAHMDQGRLSNAEHRSALILIPYIDSISRLLESGYFDDTLWQLRNARKGIYQLLYMTEIPMYIRGKAIIHRFEELYTPPTAPAQTIQFLSDSHRKVALEELHLMIRYLDFAEDKASRFDDKQLIAERVQKARQYLGRVEMRAGSGGSTSTSPRGPLASVLFSSFDEAQAAETQGHLEREIDVLKRQLTEKASQIDGSRPPERVLEETLSASLERKLDQAALDAWMTTDYARLRSFFPGYKLTSTPVPAAPEGSLLPPYDAPEALSLKGTSLERRQIVCPIAFSRRCLSPELAIMMTYFPGKAYIQSAISSWDPGLPFNIQRTTFITALALFELQNLADLDGMMTPANSLLATLMLLIEDVASALDLGILQNRLSHGDAASYFSEQLPLGADLAAAFSTTATSDYGLSLARFVARSRLRELRKTSRASNKKVSWTTFYRALLEQGTFDTAQLHSP